jgi:hypothetical protein
MSMQKPAMWHCIIPASKGRVHGGENKKATPVILMIPVTFVSGPPGDSSCGTRSCRIRIEAPGSIQTLPGERDSPWTAFHKREHAGSPAARNVRFVDPKPPLRRCDFPRTKLQEIPFKTPRPAQNSFRTVSPAPPCTTPGQDTPHDRAAKHALPIKE